MAIVLTFIHSFISGMHHYKCTAPNPDNQTTQQDLKSMNLYLNKAIDVAQNCPLRRLMSNINGSCITSHSETITKKTMMMTQDCYIWLSN